MKRFDMRIIMIDSISMANGVLRAREIYDLAPKRAQKLIDRKLAKLVDDEVEKVQVKRRITSLPHGDKS